MNKKQEMKVSIQIKTSNDWEDCGSVIFDFKDWIDVSTFCYRLSLMENKYVRAERVGSDNGTYYAPYDADNFFNEIEELKKK